MGKKGPQIKLECRGCTYLDIWSNLGPSVFAQCKKGIWKYTRQFPRGQSCTPPQECPYIEQVLKG